MLTNTDTRLGMPKWQKGLDAEFYGLRLPFGCCVSYFPSPTKDLPHGKRGPVMHVGIFAGYKVRADWHWCKIRMGRVGLRGH